MKVEIPTHRWSGALALPIKFDTVVRLGWPKFDWFCDLEAGR
jgi:hypothetical protein